MGEWGGWGFGALPKRIHDKCTAKPTNRPSAHPPVHLFGGFFLGVPFYRQIVFQDPEKSGSTFDGRGRGRASGAEMPCPGDGRGSGSAGRCLQKTPSELAGGGGHWTWWFPAICFLRCFLFFRFWAGLVVGSTSNPQVELLAEN